MFSNRSFFVSGSFLCSLQWRGLPLPRINVEIYLLVTFKNFVPPLIFINKTQQQYTHNQKARRKASWRAGRWRYNNMEEGECSLIHRLLLYTSSASWPTHGLQTKPNRRFPSSWHDVMYRRSLVCGMWRVLRTLSVYTWAGLATRAVFLLTEARIRDARHAGQRRRMTR